MGSYENQIIKVDYSVVSDTVNFRITSKLDSISGMFTMYRKYCIYLSDETRIDYDDRKINIYLSTLINKKCFKMKSKNFLRLLEVFKVTMELFTGYTTYSIFEIDSKAYYKHSRKKCFMLVDTYKKLK